MISKEEVKKIAMLSRLHLEEEEVTKYQHDLSRILESVRRLKSCKTDGVQPMTHAVFGGNVVRQDVVKESLPLEKALKNGPEVVNGFFRVPRILEEE